MKMFRILKTSIRDSFKSVFRNFSLSMAAIACTTITLILVAVSVIVSYNVKNISDTLESELTIVVYLKEDVTEDQIDIMKTNFVQLKNVEEVVFKDKEEWKLEMQEYSTSLDTTLSYLPENPLLNSFIIKVKEVKNLKETNDEILKYEGVETSEYGAGMAELIISILDVVKNVTVIIVIALVLVTAFLIGNTIKLTIFSRRSEIEIMRLVGASNSFIKMPFMFEGFILGLIGSIIPIFVAVYGYVILYNRMNGYISTQIIQLVKPFNFLWYVVALILVIGVIVGMFGSYRAVRKYLKV